jgi:hypothetical protein
MDTQKFDALMRKQVKKWAGRLSPPVDARRRLLEAAASSSRKEIERISSAAQIERHWSPGRGGISYKNPPWVHPGPDWYHGLVDLELACSATISALRFSLIQ